MRSHLCVFLVCLVSACGGSSAPTDAKSSSAPEPSPPTTTAISDANVCPLGKPDTWNACVGKLVEVRGQTPKMVSQHPMVTPMGLPGSGVPEMHQGYLDTAEGSQIIVLSREPAKCTGAMRVKGSLRGIDLGGPAGTKESYKGWAIEDATIVCE